MPSHNEPVLPSEAGNGGSAESSSSSSAQNEPEAIQPEHSDSDVQIDGENEDMSDAENEGSDGGEDGDEEVPSSDDDSSDIPMTDSDSDMSDAEVSEEDNNESFEDYVLQFMSIPGEEMQQFLSLFSRVIELLNNFVSRPFPSAREQMVSVLGDLDSLLSHLLAVQSGKREE